MSVDLQPAAFPGSVPDRPRTGRAGASGGAARHPWASRPARALDRLFPAWRQALRSRMFAIFVTVDLVLVAGYLISGILRAADVVEEIARPLSLGDETSMASLFLDAKWMLIVALLLAAFARSGRVSALLVALAFGALMADDVLEIHERTAWFWVHRFHVTAAFGLRAEDFGELLSLSLLAALVFPLLGLAYAFGDAGMRRWLHGLLALVVALAFCGVAMDMLHSAVMGLTGAVGTSLGHFVAVAEDGGELVIGTLIAVHARLLLTATPLRSPQAPWAEHAPSR